MKIVIDVDKLLRDGRITTEEYGRLKSLAVEDTGSLAFNILVGFGVIATTTGILALAPAGATALVLGLILSAGAIAIRASYQKEWGLLGTVVLVVGALVGAGGILVLTHGTLAGFLIVATLFLAAAALVNSGLLVAMAVVALSAASGGATEYWHAEYVLIIRHPTLTICLFGLSSLAATFIAKKLPLDHQRLAIIFARTSLFFVNFGFWIGSLWGDDLWSIGPRSSLGTPTVPALVFVIGWAATLLATAAWGAIRDKRWVVNVTAVFGAIHFYTQYFERLGPSPEYILMAGVLALAFAFAIVRYNKDAKRKGVATIDPLGPLPETLAGQ